MPEQKKSKKDKLHNVFGHILAVLAIVLVVVAFGGAYYFVIQPNMVAKPFIPKPYFDADSLEKIRAGESVVREEHINYIINEIGAYKLKNPFGKDSYPIMEFVITDLDDMYYSYVKDHIPFTKKGNAKGEDIVINGNQEIVYEVLSSDNVFRAVQAANSEGKIQVELVSDMKTLASKGYLSLYDALK